MRLHKNPFGIGAHLRLRRLCQTTYAPTLTYVPRLRYRRENVMASNSEEDRDDQSNHIAYLKRLLGEESQILIFKIANNSPDTVILMIDPQGGETNMEPGEIFDVVTPSEKGIPSFYIVIENGYIRLSFDNWESGVFNNRKTKLL